MRALCGREASMPETSSRLNAVWCLRQDLSYALRTLGKSRGFTAVAVVTLGLGIGASTAIFSVIENVLMEPFPYPDSSRLMTVQIHDKDKSEPGGRSLYKGPELHAIAEQNHVFD